MGTETMGSSRKKRLLFYSHDTFGLGHIRRTQKIANQLSDDNTSILIICSSPKATEFESAPGIEYLKLPSYSKLPTGAYVPKHMNIDLDSFVALRSELILATVRSFQPDLFLVDKEPLGVGGELKDSLEFIASYHPGCQTVCGLRDILDDPESLEIEWQRRGSTNALERYYKSIIVYGDQNIYDLGAQYQMSDSIRRKMSYMGYLLQPAQLDLNTLGDDLAESFEYPQRPLVLFTLGGGEDGSEYLKQIADALDSNSTTEFNAIVVTGPFLSNAEYAAFYSRIFSLPHVRCMKFSANLKSYMTRADLVVSMGGYNTFCELVSLGKRPLILPRVRPRREQLIRAEIFQRLGFCHYIHPDELSGASLRNRIVELLNGEGPPPPSLQSDGLEKTRGYIQSQLLRSADV